MNSERDEWLKERTTGIGGSDASVIMGINPWKSRLELWNEKVTGNVKEIDTPDVEWGKILEPVIADEYYKKTGRMLAVCTHQLKSEKFPFMNANVDRIILSKHDIVLPKIGRGILEIKTKGAFVDWEKDEIPDYYKCQLQHYLSVTGLSWGSFAVLDLGKKKLIIKDFERNEELIKTLIEEESKFWELVQKKTPPSVDESLSCNEFLRKLYPQEQKGKEIDIRDNKEAFQYVVDLKVIKQQIKNMEENETEIKNYLMNLMGDAEKAIGDGFSITWKRPKDRIVFDTESFKVDNPSLYNKYISNEKQSRRFMVKFEKEKDN